MGHYPKAHASRLGLLNYLVTPATRPQSHRPRSDPKHSRSASHHPWPGITEWTPAAAVVGDSFLPATWWRSSNALRGRLFVGFRHRPRRATSPAPSFLEQNQ